MPLFVDKIQNFLINNLSAEQIRYTAERYTVDLNLQKYAGLSRGMTLTKKMAARSVIDYLTEEDRILDYISYVMGFNGLGAGSSGRIQLRDTGQFFTEMANMGWIHNKKHNRFEKDQSRVKTRDWGILRTGDPYRLSFLSVDIVGSSTFADYLDLHTLSDLYREYRKFSEDLIHRFGGRIWEWSGDGYTAAFFGEGEALNTFRAAMDILTRIVSFQFRFGKLSPRTPLHLRLGADYGEILFSRDNPVAGQTHPENAGRLQTEFCKPDHLMVSGSFHKTLPIDYQHYFSPTELNMNYEPVFLLKNMGPKG